VEVGLGDRVTPLTLRTHLERLNVKKHKGAIQKKGNKQAYTVPLALSSFFSLSVAPRHSRPGPNDAVQLDFEQ
jgi:hypothetical protein